MAAKTNSLPKPKLEEVLMDRETRLAFDFLTSRNASREELWSHLQMAIMSAYVPISYDMLSVEGMTRRQIAAFPSVLRNVVRSIQLIENNFHLESKGELAGEVKTLLRLLIQYADRLESGMKRYREFMAKNPRYWNLRSVFCLRLLDYVNKTTGKPHFDKVSTLLAGGMAAANGKKDDEEIVDVDPDSLRKLFRRRSSKNTTVLD